MSQVDTMTLYVRRRLQRWGDEFALARDCEYLGHQSKNMLQILIEHRGEMPGRVQGFKPLEIDQEAQEVEDVVAEIARHNPVMACVLRAYWCGSGRKKVERWETANLLLAHVGMRMVTVDSYMDLARRGEERVCGMLVGYARAA